MYIRICYIAILISGIAVSRVTHGNSHRGADGSDLHWQAKWEYLSFDCDVIEPAFDQ